MRHMNRSGKRLNLLFFVVIIALGFIISGCNSNPENRSMDNANDTTGQAATESRIVSEKVTYMSGNDTLIGYLYYQENSNDKKPGIIVVPEWWGNNDYPQMRAEQLAKLGYTTLSADMYGNGKVVDNPQAAQENAGKVYADPNIMKSRMQAAYDFLNKNEHVEKDRIAAIGYCFGGSVCLNSASMGVPLDAVVSFHGGLEGFKATNEIKDVQTLVLNGKADKFVAPEHVANFRKEMEKVDAPYEFKEYEDATHAFTNPKATENGKQFNMPIAYNEQADKQSWQDMMQFFEKHFPPKDNIKKVKL